MVTFTFLISSLVNDAQRPNLTIIFTLLNFFGGRGGVKTVLLVGIKQHGAMVMEVMQKYIPLIHLKMSPWPSSALCSH